MSAQLIREITATPSGVVLHTYDPDDPTFIKDVSIDVKPEDVNTEIFRIHYEFAPLGEPSESTQKYHNVLNSWMGKTLIEVAFDKINRLEETCSGPSELRIREREIRDDLYKDLAKFVKG